MGGEREGGRGVQAKQEKKQQDNVNRLVVVNTIVCEER